MPTEYRLHARKSATMIHDVATVAHVPFDEILAMLNRFWRGVMNERPLADLESEAVAHVFSRDWR